MLIKLLLFPFVLFLTLVEWSLSFLVGFGGKILDLLSGIVFYIAVAGSIFQIAPASETTKMLAVSFAMFLLSRIGTWCMEKIMLPRMRIEHL